MEELQAAEAVRRLHACFFSPEKSAGIRNAEDVPFYALCQASAWP
jgi:hypothetical protein